MQFLSQVYICSISLGWRCESATVRDCWHVRQGRRLLAGHHARRSITSFDTVIAGYSGAVEARIDKHAGYPSPRLSVIVFWMAASALKEKECNAYGHISGLHLAAPGSSFGYTGRTTRCPQRQICPSIPVSRESGQRRRQLPILTPVARHSWCSFGCLPAVGLRAATLYCESAEFRPRA